MGKEESENEQWINWNGLCRHLILQLESFCRLLNVNDSLNGQGQSHCRST